MKLLVVFPLRVLKMNKTLSANYLHGFLFINIHLNIQIQRVRNLDHLYVLDSLYLDLT